MRADMYSVLYIYSHVAVDSDDGVLCCNLWGEVLVQGCRVRLRV